MLAELLPIFYNNTRSLEMLYLLEGLKDAVRLDASQHEEEKIEKFCKNHGLFALHSDFKLIKVADKGKAGFSNIVHRVPLSDPRGGLLHLYISKNEQTSLALKQCEDEGDDEKVGEMLGYPKCCIEFFLAHKQNQQQIQNDYILPCLSNSEGFSFPFYTNHAIRYFDITLLSHFPHSFQCKQSCSIGSDRLRAIEKHSPQLAGKFVALLKSAVLYTEHEGVFLLRNHSFDEDRFRFENVLSTVDNQLLKRLLIAKEFIVKDKNTIILGNEQLKDCGFMVFS